MKLSLVDFSNPQNIHLIEELEQKRNSHYQVQVRHLQGAFKEVL